MHITANCIIITQQFPIENRSEHGRFAEMPLNTTGQVQNLGDYYAIRSTCVLAPRHHSTIQIASTSCSQAQRALLHSLVCLIASFLARSFLLSFDIISYMSVIVIIIVNSLTRRSVHFMQVRAGGSRRAE